MIRFIVFGGSRVLRLTSRRSNKFLITGFSLGIFSVLSTFNNLTAGPITNNSALIINVASNLTYGETISGGGSLTKGGVGLLTLTGVNSYTGSTMVAKGKLAVNTSMSGHGSVMVAAGAELQINRNTALDSLNPTSVSLDNAALDLDLDFNPSGPVALLNVLGTLTNIGSTTINLLHPGSLTAGSFPLIKYGTYESNASSSLNLGPVSGAIATIQNNPANHSIDLVVSSPPSLTPLLSDHAAFTLRWPLDFIGWQLQEQTNPLNVGLSTNWFGIFGSTITNQFTIAIEPKNPTMFFRLAYPPVESPIFANAAFRFFSNRMEAFDLYSGIYRSTNGLSLSKDGDSTYTWTNASLTNLYLQTPFPILDAVFGLGVNGLLQVRAPAGTASAQLTGDQPGGTYYAPYFYFTHGSDIREYTRDSAQHIQWGDSTIIDKTTVRGTLLRRCDFSQNLIREDAVTTADSVHFISAAWEYFKITGDTNLLTTCWNCMWNTITSKEQTQKDTDGLWTGATWSDNVTGYLTQTHFDNRQTGVKSLYANCMVAGAWRDLGQIAATLGKTNESAQCSQKSSASVTAINVQLYRPEFGTYAYYKYQPDNTYYNYREDMSAGLLNLFDVATPERCLNYHARFTATPYGYRNVDPILPAGATAYHGGNVWENEEAYHAWAMARLGQADQLEPFIFWHARAGLPLKEWQEGTIDPVTGHFHTNYTRLSWGAMGYVSLWTRGVFGIVYEPNNFHFAPCVPNSFGTNFFAVLNKFNYRNSQLRIILTGCGTNVQQTLLDGISQTIVPSTLSGQHTVEIRMTGAGQLSIPAPLAP